MGVEPGLERKLNPKAAVAQSSMYGVRRSSGTRAESRFLTVYMGGYIGIIGYRLGLYGDNGKENRNYHIIIGYIGKVW